MVSVPVYSSSGDSKGEVEIDESLLGGEVRHDLLKQAIVSYLDHQRQDSARTKGRGQAVGSTRKIYRQKGTGRARMGNVRTCIRRGGGVAFAKSGGRRFLKLPKAMRSLAWKNAVLAKIQSGDVLIVDDLAMDKPATSSLSKVLGSIGVDRGCVLATADVDNNMYLSGRNLPKTEVRPVAQLNAYEILRRKKLVFTGSAFDTFKGRVSK